MTDPLQPRPALRNTGAPPAIDSGPYTLTICAPGRDSWILLLEPGKRYLLGRHFSSNILLDYPWVSERHAQITGEDPPEIVDLGSRNGTLVNGKLLETRVADRLPAGSVVALGSISIVISRAEELTSAVFRRAPPLNRRLEPEVQSCVAAAKRPAPVPGLVIADPRMIELYQLVEQVAQSRMSVLINGETGVGKELLAQAIHRGSPRKRRPLVTLNCAAIPETLLESELFGYERGAFSGATTPKAGMFEIADGSTLFLDEIGELPPLAQSKLLRVLESGEVLRVGAVRPTLVDVRIVAATNRDLLAQLVIGGFRADLFYRLNGITLTVPPLRERLEDITELSSHFARQGGLRAEPLFTDEALALLRAHHWRGNVRELKSVVERALLLAKGSTITSACLLLDPAPMSNVSASPLLPAKTTSPDDTEAFSRDELPTSVVRAELERRDRRRIQEALEETGGNQKDAAKRLGISRRTLMKRLDRYSLVRPRKRKEPGGA